MFATLADITNKTANPLTIRVTDDTTISQRPKISAATTINMEAHLKVPRFCALDQMSQKGTQRSFTIQIKSYLHVPHQIANS